MPHPGPRSTGRRLRPVLLGLIGSVVAFLALYVLILLITFALAPRVST